AFADRVLSGEEPFGGGLINERDAWSANPILFRENTSSNQWDLQRFEKVWRDAVRADSDGTIRCTAFNVHGGLARISQQRSCAPDCSRLDAGQRVDVSEQLIVKFWLRAARRSGHRDHILRRE